MSEDLAAIAARGRAFLAHHGVKGMKWGVRKDLRGGGGTLKVKFRPTYTKEERRAAIANVKQAKKSGSKALDREGFDQARLKEMRTPERRVVNYLLGTKESNTIKVATIAGLAATIASTGGVAAVPLGAAITANTAASLFDANRVFFKNMQANPKVRLKTDLSPNDMAKIKTGQTFRKDLISKKGSATVHIGAGGKVTVSAKDREGRSVGSQISTKAPKPAKTKK